MQYQPLVESNSTPRGSIVTLGASDNIPSDRHDHLCSTCRNKVAKKQEITHTPIDCLSERCELLENEAIRLKDHDIKARLQIKDLEHKVATMEEVLRSLTAPTQQQAAPYSFGIGHKLRHQLKKSQSADVPSEPEINYNNVLPPSRRGSRERVGLFGSLGASSQYR